MFRFHCEFTYYVRTKAGPDFTVKSRTVAVTVIVLLALGLALPRTVRGRQMLRKLEVKLHAKKKDIAEGARSSRQR